tara:strand:+ start:121 stop:621 length:501 start_codon:yes stop_codon:yes gene_type:complete
MWHIIRHKSNEHQVLINNLKKQLVNKFEFYIPKIKYSKFVKNKFIKVEKRIFPEYLFIFNETFVSKSKLNEFKYTKGLQYFLDGSFTNQEKIKNFIDYCKSKENKDGYLKPEFFDHLIKKKGKFISGPFINKVFEFIEKQGDKYKISINGIYLTIKKNTENYFNYI